MSFDDYMKSELKKPVHNYYDADGNSARAIVTRGLFKEIIMQYRLYPARLAEALSFFDWLGTPIGLIIQFPIMVLFSPVIPVLAGFHWHKKSVNEFMKEYKHSIKDNVKGLIL
jgi:hypothetical protein